MALDLNQPVTWDAFRRVWDSAINWWLDELRGLVPARLKSSSRAPKGRPQLSLAPGGWAAAGFSPTYDGPLQPRRDLLAALGAASRGRMATVFLPETSVLVRRITLPDGASGRLKDIVRLQIDRLSPLGAIGSVWGVTLDPSSGDKSAGLCAIAARDEAETIATELRDAGFAAFELADPRTGTVLAREDRGASRRRQLTRGLWIGTFLLLGSALAVTVWRTEARISALAAATAALKPKAEQVAEVRRSVLGRAELSEALAQLAEEPQPLQIWSEITAGLPDDAWVTALEISSDQVRLEGYARASATVLAGLAAATSLKAPRFEGPLQRQPDLGADRFTLRAELAGGTP